MAINTYNNRRSMGLCPVCGGVADEQGKIMCSTCRKKNAMVLARRRAAERDNLLAIHKRAIAKPSKHPLDTVQRMADERGISYGYMMATLEGRMEYRTTFHYGGVTKLGGNT